MSRATIEQSLTGLIPTLNGPLPPELIDLALSLLTRSRSVAHSLKPDEEIARPYACAQLACERLKQRLNLPTITSRPPCPPRIYKKLYAYLHSALPDSTTPREPQTPSKKPTSASASARNTPKTPASGRKTPLSTHRRDEASGDVPEWVMPGVRTLLKKFEYPAAAPNVFAGIESVLPLLARMAQAAAETPSKRARRATTAAAARGAVSDVRTLALVAVVFLYVFTKMKDVNVTPEQYKLWREMAVEVLLDIPAGKNVSQDELSLEIEEMLPMAQSEGWLQMEWFANVVPLAEGEEMEGVEATGQATGKTREQGAIRQGGSEYIGLGTMMQDATDYLGERQREDYKKWKAGIMARIEQMEAAQPA